jgi:hypothetical protein
VVVTDEGDMAARTKQLAKDLLDQLDEPESKERAEYQAQKEREDREALEKFYIATGQVKPEQVMQRALVELADQIERLNPPDGDFEAVEVPFTLHDRKAILRFGPSPSSPDKRYVELSIASESGLSTSSQWLEKATNAELVAYLRKPEVIADTIATSEELAQSLASHRLA